MVLPRSDNTDRNALKRCIYKSQKVVLRQQNLDLLEIWKRRLNTASQHLDRDGDQLWSLASAIPSLPR